MWKPHIRTKIEGEGRVSWVVILYRVFLVGHLSGWRVLPVLVPLEFCMEIVFRVRARLQLWISQCSVTKMVLLVRQHLNNNNNQNRSPRGDKASRSMGVYRGLGRFYPRAVRR
jgi:hypothetical protein